MTTNRRLV